MSSSAAAINRLQDVSIQRPLSTANSHLVVSFDYTIGYGCYVQKSFLRV